MIEVTKMNGEKFYLNPNLIEVIESTPDTLISTTSGKKYYVLEPVDDVTDRILEFYASIVRRGRKAEEERR